MFRKKRMRENQQTTYSVPAHPLEMTYEKPAYSMPMIGVRQNLLTNYRLSSYNMCRELRRDYHLALFRASIKALNCDVVEIGSIAPYSKYAFTPHVSYLYVRDPVLMLHDKHLVISTYGNESYRSRDIIKKVREITGYQHWSINNTYFEGGNMFYIPSLQTVLHGLAPGGHYGKRDCKKKFLQSRREDYYKVDPAETNRRLNKIFNRMGIDIMGLDLHPDVLTYNKSKVREHFYYHLDCFMQVLPDGRLIILNKKILSEYDQMRLQRLFGDKFIDLAYSDYLTKPVIFNFIAIPNEDNFTLISPTLPDSVLENLSKLGLSLITPESLDAEHERYNKEHAERVADILKSEGYVEADATNLATHLSRNIYGYRLENGKSLSLEKLEKKMFYQLDDCYRNQPISFVYGAGGPHCFTTEIVPIKALSLDKAKKVKQNDYAFFNRLKDSSPDKTHEVVPIGLQLDFQKNIELSIS